MMSERSNKTEKDITSLEKEFSPRNIFEYGQMCDKVAWELTEAVIDKEGEITILLPSRGALPIFMGAMLALKENKDLKELKITQRIKLPPLSCFDYVRRVVEGDSPKKGDIEVLIFPFTADINLGDKLRSEEEERQVVDDMRRFGARAVTGFLNPPGRRENFELDLFLAFLEVVEKRKGTTSFYQKLGQARNFVMIDTVISGRASFTILDELEERGFEIGKRGNLRPILVVDKNGEQLKSQFGRFIFGYPGCRIDVPRILSEDRGAALEGVVAVVYPDLIIEAHKQGLCPDCYPLLGSWHDVPLGVRKEYLDVFNSFLATIDAIVAGRDFEKERINFCVFLKNSDVLKVGDATIGGAGLNIQGVQSVIETSAHVTQADFSEERTKSIIRKISKKLQK